MNLPRQVAHEKPCAHQNLRELDDISGLPTPGTRRAIPRREVPLEGTRETAHPPGDLRKLVCSSNGAFTFEISRPARIFGWAAFVVSIAVVLLSIVGLVLQRRATGDTADLGADLQTASWITGIFVIHFLGFASQVLSDNRESRGLQAILLFWATMPILFIVEQLLSR